MALHYDSCSSEGVGQAGRVYGYVYGSKVSNDEARSSNSACDPETGVCPSPEEGALNPPLPRLTPFFQEGEYVHVVWVKRDTTYEFYRDGVLVASVPGAPATVNINSLCEHVATACSILAANPATHTPGLHCVRLGRVRLRCLRAQTTSGTTITTSVGSSMTCGSSTGTLPAAARAVDAHSSRCGSVA